MVGDSELKFQIDFHILNIITCVNGRVTQNVNANPIIKIENNDKTCNNVLKISTNIIT